MPLKILEVQAKSLAAKAGIKARDEILSINGMPVADFFDLQYYANDFLLDIELRSPRGSQANQHREASGKSPGARACRI